MEDDSLIPVFFSFFLPLTEGAIAGIVVGLFALVILVFLIWYCCCYKKSRTKPKDKDKDKEKDKAETKVFLDTQPA